MIRRQINTGPVFGGVSCTHRTPRRAGFTMVEIIVVIAIIATLASLILAAVLRVLDVGTRTENFTEIAQIESAIGEAKRALNIPQIPPGPFHLKAIYTGTEPEFGILLQAFPQMAWSGNPGVSGGNNGLPAGTNIHLDSNQTLLFFLNGSSFTNFSGFSTNPAQPFAPPPATGPGNRKGPFLQISTKYFSLNPTTSFGMALQSTISPNQGGPVTVVPGGGVPWLVDPYGLPYAYFASLNGQNGQYYAPTTGKVTTLTAGQSYQVTLTGPGAASSIAVPYQLNSAFINPQGFQIISSGKDGIFGPGGTLPPSIAAGFDDQANFSKTTLGAGKIE